jgi:hypothetical protein
MSPIKFNPSDRQITGAKGFTTPITAPDAGQTKHVTVPNTGGEATGEFKVISNKVFDSQGNEITPEQAGLKPGELAGETKQEIKYYGPDGKEITDASKATGQFTQVTKTFITPGSDKIIKTDKGYNTEKPADRTETNHEGQTVKIQVGESVPGKVLHEDTGYEHAKGPITTVHEHGKIINTKTVTVHEHGYDRTVTYKQVTEKPTTPEYQQISEHTGPQTRQVIEKLVKERGVTEADKAKVSVAERHTESQTSKTLTNVPGIEFAPAPGIHVGSVEVQGQNERSIQMVGERKTKIGPYTGVAINPYGNQNVAAGGIAPDPNRQTRQASKLAAQRQAIPRVTRDLPGFGVIETGLPQGTPYTQKSATGRAVLIDPDNNPKTPGLWAIEPSDASLSRETIQKQAKKLIAFNNGNGAEIKAALTKQFGSASYISDQSITDRFYGQTVSGLNTTLPTAYVQGSKEVRTINPSNGALIFDAEGKVFNPGPSTNPKLTKNYQPSKPLSQMTAKERDAYLVSRAADPKSFIPLSAEDAAWILKYGTQDNRDLLGQINAGNNPQERYKLNDGSSPRSFNAPIDKVRENLKKAAGQ